ncbi:hypothetical protein NDR89_23335 [Cupriavidus gilardii]|uniref:Helix-turn-helix transcriptional regulator n=1 Tax=Cupriavidus gilardii TaxID=82541 RepID=A0ABY4VQS5_9BURK|nr:hypothetical protein [Cupriavidus gilardii]USE78945.1 hypothetical protein NDR89_20120 [Cupriavidus gilardii]USE79528.1 hypothetical protein NDR89_23335 [Cupriavidus gilardii]
MGELNLDELERLAKAAGADAGIGAWEASDCAVWFPDGDGAMRVGERALVGIAHANLGAWPEMVDEEAVAEHIAAACPDTILALIARIRELERLNAVAYQNGFNDGRKSEDRYAKGWNDARRATDGQRAGVPEGAFIPRTAHEMVEFIGSNYDTMQADAWTQEEIQRPAGDLNNVRYSLTVHDLLSAFQWAGLLDAPTPPAGTVFGIPAAHALLEWNRLQSEPPIKIGREYDVAKAYVAMMAPARDAGQEAPEERIESLFRNRMTPYGLLVRALRIVAASSLYEMAQSTGRTPAELSAVEMGRKPATPELASLTAKFFADKGIHGTQAALMVAVEASKGEKG